MPMSNLPDAAVAASLPRDIRPQILSSCAEPPTGNGWLHEPKHDGWRLITIIAGDGSIKLPSRQGLDHARLFLAPFRKIAASGRPVVLDGEIAVPDDCGQRGIQIRDDSPTRRSPPAFHKTP
jgi:bifunctional non-homologous end joining protein LigD